MSDIRKRVLNGIVTSDKADKTITVTVKRRVSHPIYSKNYTVSKKYHAHDEKNEANMGDTVEIIESGPISKKKRWMLKSVVEKAKGSEV